MRYIFHALTFVLLTMHHQSYAETLVKYESILAALKSGDCNSATELLIKYKQENADKLKLHKDFAQSIENQIALCKKPKPGERIHTIANQPKPRPEEIRFEIFREFMG